MQTITQQGAERETGVHTPGPWHLGGNGFIVYAQNGYAICDVKTFHGRDDSDTENARLIAAAPELLALVRQYASECGECNGTGLVTKSYGGDGYGGRCAALADADDQPCSDCADIRTVIAKATGAA